ncbi:hypothetical protein [Brachybacterium phenoliresistens]|uniref:hypothetical protein n=1 Tax=Brachybacterium phenoliresistens TaxID=396014 RepID=UPI0031CEE121
MTATTAQISFIRTLQDEKAHRVLPTDSFEAFAAAHVGPRFAGDPRTLPIDLDTAAFDWHRGDESIMDAAFEGVDMADRAAVRAARQTAREAQRRAYFEGYKALVARIFADPTDLSKAEASEVIDALKSF